MKLTVIIYDATPVVELQEPCSSRSVVIELTPEQSEKLRLLNKFEGYRTVVLEAIS